MKFTSILAALMVLAVSVPGACQQILIDRGVRVEGLWCFPLADNPKEYLYLPSAGRLGVDKNGGPEFSFMRYVENAKSQPDSSSTITEGAGGGVLHFLALYDTPQEKVSRAEKALGKLLGDEEIKLRGPVIFTTGRYAVVSSVAKADAPFGAPEDAQPQKLIGVGNAPVFEGSKIAVSFDLDKRAAQILYNSFQMANPDISVVFEMQFEGLTNAYDATVDIDWSEINKDQQIQAGFKVLWFGADVNLACQRLVRNNAIKLVSRGEDASTEALLNTVYGKVLDLLFRKVEEPPPPKQETGVLGAISKALSSSGKSSWFSLSAGYRLKDMKSSGHTVLNFNHQSISKRTVLITFNIGDLFKRYGGDRDYFNAVNLEDPIYSQREVFVSVDGSLLEDFDKYINSVTVTVKKDHEDGTSTVREVVVDRKTFTEQANRFNVVYGWNGDNDRSKWLDYQYKVKWSFRDGGALGEDWRTTSSPMINVTPPYERREITVEGDPEAMKQAGVRYALVKVSYDFFGKPKRSQIRAKPEQDTAQKIQLIQPKGEYEYQYEINWHLSNGKDVVKPLSTDSSGLILIDELPQD